jgi:putative membrane protein
VRKEPKKALVFLTVFCAGAGLGLYLFTAPVSWMLEHYPKPTLGFFIGAVVGGIPMICHKSGVKKVTVSNFLWLASGAALVVGISGLPISGASVTETHAFYLAAAGVVSSVALILPGISFSHFLLLLGVYEQLLESIARVELRFLLPLGAGVLLGILLFCKMLENFMERYPKQSYLLILGFITGSVGQIFPEIATVGEGLVCLGTSLAGFFLTHRKIFSEGD